MRIILTTMAIAYVTLTLGGASAALAVTIRIYTMHGEPLPETFSAAILNTAAVFAATSFFGVLDMFLTLWTLLKSKDWEEEARKERDAERVAREAERAAREKELEDTRAARETERVARETERAAREKELEDTRAARETERVARETERAAREAERVAREAERESERVAREQALLETRAFHQRILDELAADRAQQTLITTRVLDLMEQMTHRLNGNSNGSNSGSGNGNDTREE